MSEKRELTLQEAVGVIEGDECDGCPYDDLCNDGGCELRYADAARRLLKELKKYIVFN